MLPPHHLRTAITLMAFLVLPAFLSGSTGKTHGVQSPGMVYICTGPKAKAYHKTKDCSGLNRCSGNIVAVSQSKAREMGRHPCKKCY